MTSQREPETSATADERAPLLAQDAVQYDGAVEPEDGAEPQKPEPELKMWYYAWRGLCVVFGILIIAVFVKGWIDADDVNVSAFHKHLAWY
jgi:hypothetical protein